MLDKNLGELKEWVNGLGANWNLFGAVDRAKQNIIEIEKALKNMESSSRIMPRTLTAENGAKALLSGEFFETVEVPDWDDEKGKTTTEIIKVPVKWSTIKEIYKAIVQKYGA